MELRGDWQERIERELGHSLTPLEQAAFDWGFAQGRTCGALSLVRSDEDWPDQPLEDHQAATYGVYLGDCDRQRLPVDWEFIHAEAGNLPQGAEQEWPAFDQLRPLRIKDQNVRLWWLEFSTGDDGSGYYGWLGGDQRGSLTVSEAIWELGDPHAEEVIRYTVQAIAAVPEIEARELEMRLHGQPGMQMVLSSLDQAQTRLRAELAEARTTYALSAALGPRSRPSSLAERRAGR